MKYEIYGLFYFKLNHFADFTKKKTATGRMCLMVENIRPPCWTHSRFDRVLTTASSAIIKNKLNFTLPFVFD